ncbi:MAG: hypothetical protein CM15mP128_4020 [Methanobacteriota archaeon]|nr:MAG: hypothetical protein CM15mP128_4020 [Euryarchaeota archaeon]
MDEIQHETPYGVVPLRCMTLTRSDERCEVVFVQRHHDASGGTVPPHRIEHRANLRAMADAKVDGLIAVCSVGTLVERLPPGRVGVAGDGIDLTGVSTTFTTTMTEFTSMANAYDEALLHRTAAVLGEDQGVSAEDLIVRIGSPKVLSSKPRPKSTPSSSLGGEVVGMTMPREAKLAAEPLAVRALCIAANWAAGRSPKAVEPTSFTRRFPPRRTGVWVRCGPCFSIRLVHDPPAYRAPTCVKTHGPERGRLDGQRCR